MSQYVYFYPTIANAKTLTMKISDPFTGINPMYYVVFADNSAEWFFGSNFEYLQKGVDVTRTFNKVINYVEAYCTAGGDAYIESVRFGE